VIEGVAFVADEDFNARILRGLARLAPGLTLATIPSLGLAGINDRELLERAARERWVLLSHDARSMTAAARERLQRNLPLPGLIIVSQQAPIGAVVSDLFLLLEAATVEELDRRVIFLPL
jgi:hypothetical protein